MTVVCHVSPPICGFFPVVHRSTKSPLAPFPSVMQRQCPATRRSWRNPWRAKYSVGGIPWLFLSNQSVRDDVIAQNPTISSGYPSSMRISLVSPCPVSSPIVQAQRQSQSRIGSGSLFHLADAVREMPSPELGQRHLRFLHSSAIKRSIRQPRSLALDCRCIRASESRITKSPLPSIRSSASSG